jgi:hypothetical protein
MADGSYLGRTLYTPDLETQFGRLFVALPCYVGDNRLPITALVDMASEWCMMPAEIAVALGYELAAGGETRISTRFGLVSGRLEIVPVEFRDDQMEPSGNAGATLEVEATWFMSEEWLGPAVIGWKGCLERMRFGLDPGHDLFYFGELQEDSE